MQNSEKRSDDTWLILLLGSGLMATAAAWIVAHRDLVHAVFFGTLELVQALATMVLIVALPLGLAPLAVRRLRGGGEGEREADAPGGTGIGPIRGLRAHFRKAASGSSGSTARVLGVVERRVGVRQVRLSMADSRHHLHVLGPTGTGKSTLLLALAAQDIAAGRGCAVLDPKGDLVQDLLARIPRARLADVVYVGLADPDYAVGINPLRLGPGDDPELVAENVLTIFKRIYRDHWGPRTDDILKSCLLTLVHMNEPTLAHIPRILEDARFRQPIVASCPDPIGLAGFWRWYETLSDAQRTEAVGPVLNKLREVLLRPRLRRILCQSASTVDLGDVINHGKILLADLGTGRWGESASALVGSFVVAGLWQAALARQALREDARRDFLLYIDEFQNFLGIRGPFADALAQARGLRLSLTVANQHLGQLPRELQEALGSNARSRAVFSCGERDAATLAREFSPLTPSDLTSLHRFEAAARLLVRGEAAPVQRFRTLPLAKVGAGFAPASEVLGAARRYGAPVRYVDAYLTKLLGLSGAAPVRYGTEDQSSDDGPGDQ